MRASVIAVFLIVAALAGCGNAEKQRQTEEYERFLEDALGSVASSS
jgi:uncharacterized lipoprotein